MIARCKTEKGDYKLLENGDWTGPDKELVLTLNQVASLRPQGPSSGASGWNESRLAEEILKKAYGRKVSMEFFEPPHTEGVEF